MKARPNWTAIAALCFFVATLAACSTAKRVTIVVDGNKRVVETQAATVDQVLREQKIALGEVDRVDPPEFTPIQRTATIQVVRVEIKTEQTREPVEFARRLTRDETQPDGKMRVVQLGTNGEAQVTYQTTFEDHHEISRRQVQRVTIKEPQDEVLAVGTKNALASVELKGTVVFLAQGNAWLMRNSSNDKRPLTFDGDLDGRVFDLSPDGKYLLFTRAGKDNLNSVWLADTVILEEKPRRVPLDNLLYAQWAGDGSAQVAYSTGEKTTGAPGWKAHNDLNVASLRGITETVPLTSTVITHTTVSGTVPVTTTIIITSRDNKRTVLETHTTVLLETVAQTVPITNTTVTATTVSAKTPITLTSQKIISPSAPAPYSWWGGNWGWAPDTNAFAYSFPNQIGLTSVTTGIRRAFKQFAFYNTRKDWVWLPQLSWSPDSRFVAATVHGAPEGAGSTEDSPTFDVWILSRDHTVEVPFAQNTGMWYFPTW